MNESRLEQQIQKHLKGISFSIELPNGHEMKFGDADSTFTIKINNENVFSPLACFDECHFAEAYINGDLDIEGDIWNFIGCRDSLTDLHPIYNIFTKVMPLINGQLRTDKNAISSHYEYDSDFFLSFMDSSRCYSQAIFERDDEPLESAQKRKLDFIIDSCHLKEGDRVLDVGGGWGTFVEYAGKQGIHVTALTLAKASEKYLKDLIERSNLPCQVRYEDFYEHRTSHPYDAIVILGVMEHLPNYRAVVKQFEHLLRPGGRIYLDASSFRKKYFKPTFISRYVFPGNHRFLCLHDFLGQVSKTHLEIKCIFNDRHSYYLTCREWAKNLEIAHDEIVSLCSEKIYRIFRIYLWGSSYAFFSHGMDAFRVVLERPDIRKNT